MSVILYLALAFAAGLVLGAFHFVSLWMTLHKLPSAKHPALVSTASYLIRMAVTLLGFYLVMRGSWERLLVCLGGFIVTRMYLVRRYGPRR